jgi:hypothetical protein
MRLVALLTGLLICALLVSGCIQAAAPNETATSGNHSSPSNLSPNPEKTEISPLPDTSTVVVARYQTGDIVDFNPNAKKEPHIIILAYDPATARYQYDIIYSQKNGSWGYRLYPELRWNNRTMIENYEPYLIAHINLTDLETRYPSRGIFENGT